jgi:hypothetical protein
MGLAERRAAKDFQDNYLPQLQAQIDQAAKMPVCLEIDWQSLMPEDQAHILVECWQKVYFEPLIAAFSSITRDELGTETLRAGLKKVVIKNSAGNYYGDRWANFADGILTLDHLPTSNIGDVYDRTNGLIKVLEKGL